jgi:sec-independent protein translocase protein TatC
MAQGAPDSPAETEQPLLAHLLELRSRFIRALLGVLVLLVPMAVFAKPIYAWFAKPLVRLMPEGTTMIATKVVSPFLIPLKLSAFLALFLAMPWVLYQIWAFVAPGLYKHERRLIVPLLASSTLLFYAGIAFAYFVTLPVVFKFVIGAAPEGIKVATDISDYLDFMMTMFVAFGVAFETPVAVVLLVWTGFVSTARLKESRGYVLVAVFFIAAIITPPDVFSQVMVAIPSYLLYELGLLWAGFVERDKARRTRAGTEAG